MQTRQTKRIFFGKTKEVTNYWITIQSSRGRQGSLRKQLLITMSSALCSTVSGVSTHNGRVSPTTCYSSPIKRLPEECEEGKYRLKKSPSKLNPTVGLLTSSIFATATINDWLSDFITVLANQSLANMRDGSMCAINLVLNFKEIKPGENAATIWKF